MTVELNESFPICEKASDIRLDKKKGVIHGIKLVGPISTNNRVYPRKVLESALAKYDGVKSNLNHLEVFGDQSRNFEERIAIIRNPVFREDGSIYGDAHYNTAHPWASTLEWWVENEPTAVGMSQVAYGTFEENQDSEGRDVVKAIDKVHSVDFVADPGSTSGLFESAKGSTKGHDMLVDLYVRNGGRLTEKIKSLIEALKEGSDEPITQTVEDDVMSDTLKECDLNGLKSGRPDLVKALEAEISESESSKMKDTEIKQLKEKVDEFEAKSALNDRRDHITKLLEEAKLPKQVVTDLFIEQLETADGDSAVSALIEDRKLLARGTSGAGKGSPKSASKESLEESGSGSPVTDRKSFVEALNSGR